MQSRAIARVLRACAPARARTLSEWSTEATSRACASRRRAPRRGEQSRDALVLDREERREPRRGLGIVDRLVGRG